MSPQRIKHLVTKYNISYKNFVLKLRFIYAVIKWMKSNNFFFVNFIPLFYIILTLT
jgi:hypothetical protein